MSFIIEHGDSINIIYDFTESEAVSIAINNLKTDLQRTVGVRLYKGNGNLFGNATDIIVGTIGVSQIIDAFDVPVAMLDENGKLKKEAYTIMEFSDSLVIMGSDRRGTIYGIYEFCEMLGVSPWYYFADVPIKEKARFELEDGYVKTDYPTVEYRGFFINDGDYRT